MADNDNTRGEWVVGLNPDDRMPNDYLRMVARVFAAYRKKPLKESIVVYIDGLNVSLTSHANDIAVVNITDGQSFVDDQFIGFIEDSTFEFETDRMPDRMEFCIVLQYQWINQMPPESPHFNLVKSSDVHPQQMLCLAQATMIDGVLVIVDEKKPWYIDMVLAAAGNTEVDGESLLPYVVAIKGPGEGEYPENPDDSVGTLDIGWALDFHHYVGNDVNYNARLHTDKVNDGVLYVSGNRLLSELDPTAINPNDPSDTGDSFIGIANNMTLMDTIDDNGILGNVTSDSGKSCFTLKTTYIPMDSTGNPTIEKAGKLCFDHATTGLTLENRLDYVDASSSINTLTLTEVVDVVTLNGKRLWHEGNLTTSGESIMFMGYRPDAPTERLDTTPLQDGDTYYNTLMHTFWYYFVDPTVPVEEWVEVGRSDAFKQYEEIIALDGTTFISVDYNPQYVQVTVGGAVLSKALGDYTVDTNGTVINFTKPLRAGEIVQIMSIFKGQAIGVSLGQLNDVDLINLSDNDAIVYNSATATWVNEPIGVSSLDDIGDVYTADAVLGDTLVYDGIRWTTESAAQMQLGDLGDVNFVNTSPVAGQALTYMGNAEWSNTSIIEAGFIGTFAGEVAPSGWLVADGSSLLVASYQDLFDNIGYRYGGSGTTFRLPDLRGEFIRGIDQGRGIDAGRVFGTRQTDAIRNITGNLGRPSGAAWDALFLQDDPEPAGAFATQTGTYVVQGAASGTQNDAVGYLEFDASLVVPTAAENRPDNVALLQCIKY